MITFDISSGILLQQPIPPLHTDSWVEAPVVIQASLAPNNLVQIGGFTGIYGGRLGHCRIGRYCSIAADVNIAADQHPVDWLSTSMFQYVPNLHQWQTWMESKGIPYAPTNNHFNSNSVVTIGNDVWIGQGVFIKSGVSIGDGAIIAARSVVIADVPPYAVVAGVPAKVKKYRFPDETIEKLKSLRWWDYNIQAISNRLDYSKVEESIATLNTAIEEKELVPFDFRRHPLVLKS